MKVEMLKFAREDAEYDGRCSCSEARYYREVLKLVRRYFDTCDTIEDDLEVMNAVEQAIKYSNTFKEGKHGC